MDNMFQAARTRLDEAAKYLDIHEDVMEQLRYPKETLAATLSIRMDDGSVRSSNPGGAATTTPVVRPRAAFAIIPTSASTRS